MQKKIRVLHLCSSLPIGGSCRLLIDILKYFSPKNYINNILVVTSDFVAPNYMQELSDLGTDSCYILKNQSLVSIIIELLRIIKKNKTQIIHCDGFEGFKKSIILKFLMPKLKLVYTIHDTNLIGKYRKRSIFAKNLFVDAHIAISKAVEQECKNVSLKNIVQIDNGVDLSKFNNYHSNTNQNKDFLKIINVARIQLPKKGQDILIKALNECKKRGIKFSCDFVGGIDDVDIDSFNYLKSLVKEYNLENEIRFLGNRTDIAELLQQSDLFILPSRFEGFGLVILEAMASGLPVIATNIDGPKEIITNGVNGLLFENENHIDLADNIMKLYNDRNKMLEVANAGFELSKNYSIDSMCDKYYELYRTLLTK